MNVIYYYNLERKVHVLINSKYHNDPFPTPPCSMLFSQGYCFILRGAENYLLSYYIKGLHFGTLQGNVHLSDF